MNDRHHLRTTLRVAVIVALSAVAWTVFAATASAGEWVQVSCTNPDGTGSTSQGWTASAVGAVQPGSGASTACAPGTPMTAYIGTAVTSPGGSEELLSYTPPAGSTLVGGVLNISGAAPGYSSINQPPVVGSTTSPEAIATTDVYSPSGVPDAADTVFQCAYDTTACFTGSNYAFFGQLVNLPTNAGGGIFVAAACAGSASYSCDSGGVNGVYADIDLGAATLLLRNGSRPTGTHVGGSLLSSHARGSRALSFTANDPGGPGVYVVSVIVDRRTVYSATPNGNNGDCVSHGTYAGVLEFDFAQPCLRSEPVNIPVDTSKLSAGRHTVTVVVSDAAGNTRTVARRTFSLRAAPKLRAHFLLHTHFSGATTRLLSTAIGKLPRGARVTLSTTGPGHPRLRPSSAGARTLKALERSLSRDVFHAGDKLELTVSAPGQRTEHLTLTFRVNRQPATALTWNR